MPYFKPQEVPVKCPQCGTEIIVPAFSIIDAEDMPDVVNALIMGVLNVFTCPRCGATGMLDVPLFYHHGKKQLAFVYMPHRADFNQERRQRIIGDMTRAIMRSLPDDHPKGYLLQPREFLTLPSLLDAIMEAEGIDKEALEERREKGELIDRLLAVLDDNVAFAAVVGQHKDKLDPEFYALIRYARDTAEAIGHKEEAQKLETLRQRLLPMTEWGRKEQAYDKAVEFLRKQPSREDLLEQLIQASEDQEVEALIRVARPLADYQFFQMLTERIEKERQAQREEEASRLEQLRERVLSLTEEVDRETQKALERAAELLRHFLTVSDLEKAVEEHLREIDDVFLFLLSSEMKEAERAGLKEAYQRLQAVWEAIEKHLRPQVPPELLLIETLLTLSYPEETRTYLQQHRDQITPELTELMRVLAEDLERQGEREGAKHLREIRAQALAVLAQK